ncbi:MAG TPA: hypothetical protein DDW95_04450 [Alphaproteobacteria bacterium]|jgi:hypothetical protein|nr:hypothetical protein [Alphaproteobacteria bacterium]HBF97780.1 hypothetical protein [Alphaproteobacteria bacterium]
MKINVTVDCTPKEAREFFGLPDIEPMQQRLLSEAEERFKKNLAAMDVETLMKTMTGTAFGNMERWQDFMSSMLQGGVGGKRGDD